MPATEEVVASRARISGDLVDFGIEAEGLEAFAAIASTRTINVKNPQSDAAGNSSRKIDHSPSSLSHSIRPPLSFA